MLKISGSKIHKAAFLGFFGLEAKSRMQNGNHFAKKFYMVFSFILQNNGPKSIFFLTQMEI